MMFTKMILALFNPATQVLKASIQI